MINGDPAFFVLGWSLRLELVLDIVADMVAKVD